MGLPDRDYYLKTDEKSVEIRQGYVAHVIRMFELMGDATSVSARKAKAIMDIETQLAGASLGPGARRDPDRVYHPYKIAELISLSPGFDWVKYFDSLGQPGLATLTVSYPPFIRQMESIIVQSPLEDIKAYLVWSLLRETVALLPAPFVEENFNFYGKQLEGKKLLRARWKRCVDLTNQQMGDAPGPTLRRANLRPARQRADPPNGESHRRRTRPRHRFAALDDERDEAGSLREATPDRRQDRLSG